jgi:hypothetical protein
MKKYIFIILLSPVALLNQGIAQNTYPFPSSGNVGIGTTSPTAPLAFGSSLSNTKIALWEGTLNGQPIVYGLGIQPYQFRFHVAASDAHFSFLSNAAGTTELMTILGTGNVGIGTTTPQAKLAVNGEIYAKKVKVTQTGWPDYVFQASYRLRPLSEVEQYIKQYHHLPEVPSAEEIENNGLDVGENQAVLLKKVEELTLYLLQQNNLIQQLTGKVRALEVEVQQIRK